MFMHDINLIEAFNSLTRGLSAIMMPFFFCGRISAVLPFMFALWVCSATPTFTVCVKNADEQV